MFYWRTIDQVSSPFILLICSFFFRSFYLTSIYDHSIHEAFSKIIQSQMRQLRDLENMLDLVTAVIDLNDDFILIPSSSFSRQHNWIRSSFVIFTINFVSLRIRNLSKVNYRNYVVMLSMFIPIFQQSMGKKWNNNKISKFSSMSWFIIVENSIENWGEY